MNNNFLIYLLLLITQITFGQGNDYNFININTKNGLSSNSVNSIIKDKYGFMWFGTNDGLNKFDGQSFDIYRHSETDSNSIGRGVIMAMQEDKDGNLWIGSTITLSMYNRSLNNFINYDFSKLGWIRSLRADHLGNIWVGTYSGLFRFNPKTKKITAYKAEPLKADKLNSNVILSVFEDSKNRIWVGTNLGLHLLNPTNGVIKRILHNPNLPESISSDIIRSMVEDKDGNIWVGTGGGLNIMNPQNLTFKSYKSVKSDAHTLSDNSIYKIAIDKENKLWVGTEGGLNIFNPITKANVRIDKSTINILKVPSAIPPAEFVHLILSVLLSTW